MIKWSGLGWDILSLNPQEEVSHELAVYVGLELWKD